jgi:hypothetical protein
MKYRENSRERISYQYHTFSRQASEASAIVELIPFRPILAGRQEEYISVKNENRVYAYMLFTIKQSFQAEIGRKRVNQEI